MAQKSVIENRKAERLWVVDRKAHGLHSKVAVMKYQNNLTDSEDSNKELVI